MVTAPAAGDSGWPTVGIDLGGSKLAVGALTGAVGPDAVPAGLLTGYRAAPVEFRDYDATLDTIAGHVADLRDRLGVRPAAVGVALAGFLSADRAMVVEALNLGWTKKSLRADLADRTGLPVVVHNDANAAAWGEYLLAGSPGAGAFVMLTLGTDVGGGVIAEGRLLTGAFGVGGELGHLVVEPGGPVCVCGASGCLAVYASGKAITARVRQEWAAANGVVDVSGESLTRLAALGDPVVLAVIDEAARAIAVASAQVSRVVDHHTLVIGGGASRLGTPLLDAVTRHLARGVPLGPVRPTPRVLLARAGNQAGVLGAAALAHAATVSTPHR